MSADPYAEAERLRDRFSSMRMSPTQFADSEVQGLYDRATFPFDDTIWS